MYDDDVRYEEEINLGDYFRVISKRRWTIITFFLVVVVITAIATFRMTPMYKAQAKILLDEEKLKVVSFQDVLTTDTTRAQYYLNQQEILTSRGLAKRVIEELKLENSPEFAPEEGTNVEFKKVLTWFRSVLPGKKEESVQISNDPIERTVDAFLQRLNVTFVRNSGVANVSFYAKRPDLAANIVNKVAELYIEQDMERKYGATKNAANWLDLKLAGLRENLKVSEYALQKYKEQNDIVSLEDKQNIVVQKLSELNTALTHAKTERMGLETLYDQVKGYGRDGKNSAAFEAVPAVIENGLIQKLKQDYMKLQGDYSELSSRYGEMHPKVVRLTAQMETAREKLQEEIGKIIGSMKTQYLAAKAKEEALADALQKQKEEALELNKKSIQYGVLKREVDSNRDLYDVFLTRLKETDLSKEIQSSNMRILDAAKIPDSPAKPNKKLNLALAVVVGLVLGLGLAFVGEYMDATIKTPDEVERQLKVSSLGVVNIADKQDLEKGDLVVLDAPKSRIAENLFAIRTNVIFSFSDDLSRTFLVTSAIPVEGKTFITKNLAVSLANLNKSVILVDADVRKPSLHKAFGIDVSPGLSDVLVGESVFETSVKNTSIPNLSLLPAGTSAPNPVDLLGSDRMMGLVEELKKRYDWVIFDTPPLVSVVDAAVLCSKGTKVLFIVKSGQTRKDAVKQALKQIETVNGKVLGVVLNFVDFKKERYYYSYYHKYYNYYYDREGTKKKKVKA